VTFAIGVATGIVMEFQFGTNWSEYSRFVGDIFGAPLAAEGIFAFFLESTFLGILAYGYNRFSSRTLTVASFLVAFGATLSGLWIIIANSWMQTPDGFEIVATSIGKRAVLTDFWKAALNPSTVPRFLHTIIGALITGAFFVTGISAWLILKRRSVELGKASFKMALIVGIIASIAQLGSGHFHAVQVAETQPEKLAAFEGLFETQKSAPLSIIGIPDSEAEKTHAHIALPGMLSLLISGDFNKEIRGLKDFPKKHWPPLGITYFSYHLMFIMGMYFIGLSLAGGFLYLKKKLFSNKLFLTLFLFSIPVPFVANQLGWIAAEVGRQPWIVYHVMMTKDAISPNVSSGEIIASLVIFLLVYTFLFFLWIYLLKRILQTKTEEEPKGASNLKEVIS
jgi:cytochrome d ubiquinol oxidase subunit I